VVAGVCDGLEIASAEWTEKYLPGTEGFALSHVLLAVSLGKDTEGYATVEAVWGPRDRVVPGLAQASAVDVVGRGRLGHALAAMAAPAPGFFVCVGAVADAVVIFSVGGHVQPDVVAAAARAVRPIVHFGFARVGAVLVRQGNVLVFELPAGNHDAHVSVIEVLHALGVGPAVEEELVAEVALVGLVRVHDVGAEGSPSRSGI